MGSDSGTRDLIFGVLLRTWGTAVGRRPKPLDRDHPLHAFAIDLRLLRDQAGAVGSVRTTCQEASIGRSTYYSYLKGMNLPDRENLERVIRLWGGDVGAWLDRRRQVEEALAKLQAAPAGRPEDESELYTVMVLGIHQLRTRDDHHQIHLRRRFDAVWGGAIRRLGVQREIKSADRGDSWLFWEPGIRLASEAFSRLLPYMAQLLNYENHDVESSGLLRIRGALHITHAREAVGGVHGSNVNEVYRFADSPVLRSELSETPCDLAVIFSDHAKRMGDLHPQPETFRGIHVDGWKEWAGGTAWLYTPLRSPSDPE